MVRLPHGVKSDGTPIQAFTLTAGALAAGGLSATILDMGGTITAITLPLPGGGSRNVVLGLKDAAALSDGDRMPEVFKFAKGFVDNDIQQAIIHAHIRCNLKMCTIERCIADGYLDSLE